MKKVQKYFYCFLSILCLCILTFSLSGCSEIKDGIVGTSAGGGKPEGEAPKSDVSITTERTKQIGDVCELRTMSDNDFDTSTVRWKCIVQKAKLYDKPSDAEIDTGRIITSEYYKSPEMPASVYFFIFPLLISIPYGWSYCEEKKNGYIGAVVAKAGKTSYFLAKYIAVFLTGGLAMVIPLIFNFLLAMLFFPVATPQPIYSTIYGIYYSSLMSDLFYTYPFLYVFFYLTLDFVYCGLLACICLAVSRWIKQKWVVVILPLFICLTLTYGQRFIYTSPLSVQYKQTSPLYFLHPVEIQYPASWFFILISALVIFATTLLIHLVWERSHEIY